MLSDFKRKLSQRQMYYYLLEACRNFKRANSKKLDVDRMNRSCNKYAIKHTVSCWKKQWEKGNGNIN